MDHYEVRFWRGWQHHMTLVILAHHFLVRLRQRLMRRAASADAPGDLLQSPRGREGARTAAGSR